MKMAEKINEIDRLFDQLSELSSISGVSGCEQDVVRCLRDKLAPLADEVSVDAFGNLVALRKGGSPGPRLMISVHSDEVGAVVTSITSDGFLGFIPVGVVDPRILPTMRLLVNKKVIGMVSCMPGHASTEQVGQATSNKNLYVDIGAKSDTQVREMGIQIGNTVSFISPATRLAQPNLVMGKAMDNRIGCSILIKLFEYLKGRKFPGELYGVVTVQEEMAMSGAKIVSNRIAPDYAIVVDTVPLDDTPLQSMLDIPIHLGGGPVVQLRTGKGNLFLGTVANENITRLIVAAAAELKVSVQRLAAYGKWATDAEVIHTSGHGIPLGFVSIPRRYGHTPNEMIDLNDARQALEILCVIVEKKMDQFSPDFLK
jgi:putative aminopeptidase